MNEKIFSSFDISELTELFKVEDALQIIIENLREIEDLLVIIINYHELAQKQVITYTSEQLVPKEQTTLSYLYSEKWYSKNIPEAEIILLTIPTDLLTYGYIFPPKNAVLEYILILTKTELCEQQKKYFANQIQLINIYLNMTQAYEQKSKQVKMLEETLEVCEHQLRHSLSSINLFAENLFLGLSQHPLQEQAEFIKNSSANIQEYLDKTILEINRYKPKLRAENLEEIIINSWQEISSIYQEKKIYLQLNSEGVLVLVDRWQIKQVIDNIFANGIHFSPTDGNITCQWYLFPREVLIEIIDQGQGFPIEALSKVFTPYFTLREGGRGIGLAIAKKIIQLHQGRIWAENLPTQGAKICFTLPRYL